MNRLPFLSTPILALLCLAGHVEAHTKLVSPNGGEVLRVGTKVTIRWSIAIQHVQHNWDLWYSTTGPFGSWIKIKMNMPPSQLSLVWTVPDTISSKVRFRIRMDNVGTNYEDISDKDTTIAASLSGDTKQVSVATGGTQTLTLDADTQSAMRGYWVVGSVTGTKPGVPLGGVVVPLRYDFYTDFTVAAPNSTVLSTSRGTLDAKGRGKATFNVPKGLGSAAVGVTIYHAFITFTGTTIHMASNPVSLKLVK